MDAAGSVPLVASLVALGLVLLAVAGAARSGGLERNGLVGIRTRSTRSSDRAWAAGHLAAAGALRTTGWLVLAAGALTLLLPLLVPDGYAGAAAGAGAGTGYLALLAGLLVSTRRANRAAQATSPEPPDPPR